MRGKTRGLLAVLLGVALALVAALGAVPREALAGTDTYTSLIPTADDDTADELNAKKVSFNGYDWYVIEDNSEAENEGTLTLLAADNVATDQAFKADMSSNKYSQSDVIGVLKAMTETGDFKDVAGAIVTIESLTTNEYNGNGVYDTAEDVKLYLLSTQETKDVPQNVLKTGIDWWLRSPGTSDDSVQAAFVKGEYGMVKDSGNPVHVELGVRPALKLNLESVIFESESKIFSLPGKVTGVTLNPSAVQTIDVNGKVTFTATVAPENATDKTVKWGVEGSAVKLYSDATCKTEVGTDATETLTVYAKGVSAGEATVTCTSNADKTKSASCEVTVSAAKHAVTVAASPAEGGTAEASPAEAAEGEKVTLTATATDGYEFVNWTLEGDGAKLDNADSATTKLTMGAADVTATANFKKKAEPTPVAVPDASVTAHVQRIGWMDPVTDGTAAGTTGKSRRMEALTLKLPDGVAGGIEYRGHVQRSGWEKDWKADGAQSGTTGKSRRVEAVQIQLTGEAKDAYDVYYRVHVQRYGWMAWAKNGEEAGTQGMSRRAEAIQVVLVRKDAPAPDATYKGVTQQYAKAFVKK